MCAFQFILQPKNIPKYLKFSNQISTFLKNLIFSTMRMVLFVKPTIVVFCGLIERSSVLHHISTQLSPSVIMLEIVFMNLPLATVTTSLTYPMQNGLKEFRAFRSESTIRHYKISDRTLLLDN